MAGLGRKVFNSGDILLASEVQGYLQDQAVMVFDDSATRATAIGTANFSEGMVTYTKDDDAIQVYDGSAFVGVGSDSGLIHINTTTISSGVSSVSLGSDANPIFTSTYNNYRIIITSKSATSADRTIAIRWRQNVTDASGTNYAFANQGITAAAGTINNTGATGTSAIISGNAYFNDGNYVIVLDVANPFLTTEYTYHTGMNTGSTSTAMTHQSFSGVHIVAAAYNGFTILNSSGNFSSGKIQVYGYKE